MSFLVVAGGVTDRVSACGYFWSSRAVVAMGFMALRGDYGLFLVLGFISFPVEDKRDQITWKSALRDLDLVGIVISIVVFGSLGFDLLLCMLLTIYLRHGIWTLANKELSDSVSKITSPQVILSLTITVVFGAGFIPWMSMRQHQRLSLLIPSSLWRNSRFNVTCVLVILCWATSNSIEWFFSLL